MSLCLSLSLCLKQSNDISPNQLWVTPRPSSYTIEEKNKKSKRGALYQSCIFIYSLYATNPYPWIQMECFQLRKIKAQTNIVLIYIKNTNPFNTTNKATFIYSHSNNGDIGTYLPLLIDLSTQLKRNVISYDYSGYGRSEGEASDTAIESDIDQVMDFSINNLRLSKQSIVLVGHSGGAILPIYAASQWEYCSIKGMILISPLVNQREGNRKSFNNYFDLATEVLCPVLLIHGKLDKTVSFNQSEQLKERLRCCFTWFPDAGNHFNLFRAYRRKYYKKVKKFVDSLENNSTKMNSNMTNIKLTNMMNSFDQNSSLPFLIESLPSNLSIELQPKKSKNV